jgi:cation transport ATPase
VQCRQRGDATSIRCLTRSRSNISGPREWTEGIQIEIHIGHVRADEIVIVPPGEQIPVTGTVIAGHD